MSSRCVSLVLPVLQRPFQRDTGSASGARLGRGFTLVELLVVIAIIGILISLLLPAVQMAREAARRMQCSGNLKQVALAVLNYESAHRCFPPSSHWNLPDGASVDNPTTNKYSENWVILVLPFLEEQSLYDRFDGTKYITDPANAAARGTIVAPLRCPTDIFNDQPFNGSATTAAELLPVGDGWARGNYAANGAETLLTAGCSLIQGLPECGAYPTSPGWMNNALRGMMGANAAVRVRDVTDGLSKTLLLAEIRAGVNAADPRGAWALSGGATSLWCYGSFWWGDDAGPNNGNGLGDNVISGNSIAALAGCPMTGTYPSGTCPLLLAEGMGCAPVSPEQTTPRSMHAGGIFAALADGSVHFIEDSIDISGNFSATPIVFSVWDCLILSADGQVIENGSF